MGNTDEEKTAVKIELDFEGAVDPEIAAMGAITKLLENQKFDNKACNRMLNYCRDRINRNE